MGGDCVLYCAIVEGEAWWKWVRLLSLFSHVCLCVLSVLGKYRKLNWGAAGLYLNMRVRSNPGAAELKEKGVREFTIKLPLCIILYSELQSSNKMSTDEVPLSPAAQDAKEVMQQELLRNMAKKMMATAVEEERQRRIKALEELQSPEQEDAIRKNAYEKLMVVQEDLVRSMNLMKVCMHGLDVAKLIGAALS